MRHPVLTTLAMTVIAVLAPSTVAAQQGDAHPSHGRVDLTPQQKRGVAEVTNATKQFADISAARAAGYTKQHPAGCAVAPVMSDGAQGFHYLNEALVDSTVDLLRPELVMYEPQPDGKLQLIGVDYVVPLTHSATPPTLLGVPFMRNEPLGVWALHIWTARPNPSGMFAAWNPKVSCQYAAKVTP